MTVKKLFPQKGIVPAILIMWVGIALAVSVASYLGIRKYRAYRVYQAEQQQKWKDQQVAEAQAAATREQQLQDQLAAQQEALDDAQAAIQQLKGDSSAANQKVTKMERELGSQNISDPSTISSQDLAPYISGIVQVVCTYPDVTISGSGTLWKMDGGLSVLTNNHVVGDNRTDLQGCVARVRDSSDKDRGIYDLDIQHISRWVDKTDIAVLSLLGTDKGEAPFEYNGEKLCGNNAEMKSDGLCHYTEPLNQKNLATTPVQRKHA